MWSNPLNTEVLKYTFKKNLFTQHVLARDITPYKIFQFSYLNPENNLKKLTSTHFRFLLIEKESHPLQSKLSIPSIHFKMKKLSKNLQTNPSQESLIGCTNHLKQFFLKSNYLLSKCISMYRFISMNLNFSEPVQRPATTWSQRWRW